jgi:hypothetical protein
MAGNIDLLTGLHPHVISYVTFGDGAKGEIKGIGKLDCPGVPDLDNVLLVKGLTANLISISQLCDQGLNVNFTKTECLITNKESEVIMKGVRTKDNCYMWSSQIGYSSKGTLVKEEGVKTWHLRLSHLHLKGMKMIISAEAIRGTPKLKIDERKVCGKCQTRMSHQKLRHDTTFKGLELLHMDLMGPMQVESLGGKKFANVVVDDFSRYTWINFIRNKFDVFEVFKDLCLKLQGEKESQVIKIRSEQRRKMDPKRLFLGYSRAYRVLNSRIKIMMESINGVVDDQQTDVSDDVKTSLNDPPAEFSDKENEPPQAKPDKVNMRPSIRV